MSSNTLRLPGLTFRSLPTRHISSTRASDAVAKLQYATHQADEESRQLIARLRDEAEAESKASEHRCIHNVGSATSTLPPTLFERGDRPSVAQAFLLAMLLIGFTIAAVMSIHDGVVAQHPHQIHDAGMVAGSAKEWRDVEVK